MTGESKWKRTPWRFSSSVHGSSHRSVVGPSRTPSVRVLLRAKSARIWMPFDATVRALPFFGSIATMKRVV